MPVKVLQNMSLNEEVNPVNGVQNSILTANSPVANEPHNVLLDAAQEPQVTRELTQTDRINKHLLKSFLDRINATGQIMEEFSTNSSQTSAENESDGFEEHAFIGTQIL